MPNITIEPKRLRGIVTPPPDKSISHRAIIIGSLAQGQSRLRNLSFCKDCLCTIEAFRSMGITITKKKGLCYVQGKGLMGLRRPKKGELYLGNSGTSMRLILGILAGQRFSCVLSGDASLSRRPMKRVILPLSLMGIKVAAGGKQGFAPLTIRGGRPSPLRYKTPVASAQVKSAVLLSGLYAEGTTTVREAVKSRDHTERMLKRFGADIFVEGLSVSIKGRGSLVAQEMEVPGDISAASFFLVGACICRNSQVTVQSVGLNPTRIAILGILQKMGARLSWRCGVAQKAGEDSYDEARGEVTAHYSELQAVTIRPEQIPSLIDELPVLMVAATQSEGETVIEGAGELRVKETDRVKSMVSNLARMGADIESKKNDVIIRGPCRLTGSTVDSFNDHRTAMSMAIAGLAARGRTCIKDIDCVNVSFPGFFKELLRLSS